MLCTTIKAYSLKEALSQIRFAHNSDIIELRIDYIKSINKNIIKKLIHFSKKPVIVTIRPKIEFGQFIRKEDERIGLLKYAVECGASYIDIDLSSNKSKELINFKNKIKSKTKIICSYHNFIKTNQAEIFSKYNKIKKLKPDIIKIVTLANDINDNISIYNLLKKAAAEEKKIIAFCMGEHGISSRILCLKFGSYLTFASVEEGKESAPGQLDIKTMKYVYQCDKINDKTKVYGLVGNPVNKSLGYILHNYLFKNQNKIYLNFLADDLNLFFKNYKSIISGLSITMPFKEDAALLVDRLDSNAKKTSSINTIINKKNSLVGYNTDYIGALMAIEEKTNIDGKNVLIIGTGGLAKSIAYCIITNGGKITISGRNSAKLKKISGLFRCSSIILNKITNLKNYDILVNATSVGMIPNINQSIVDKKILHKNLAVFDSVYNPIKTKLLREAEIKGCKLIYGYKLFLYQAIFQQKLFSNKIPSIKKLENLLLKNLR